MNNRLGDREFTFLLKLKRKHHRLSNQLKFLQNCYNNNIIPTSLRFSNKSLTENTLHKLRLENLNKIIINLSLNISSQFELFQHHFNLLSSSFTPVNKMIFSKPLLIKFQKANTKMIKNAKRNFKTSYRKINLLLLQRSKLKTTFTISVFLLLSSSKCNFEVL